MDEHDRAVPLAEEYMRRVPNDLYAYITLTIAYVLAGKPERAAETMNAFRELFPNYSIADFVAHEPYRDDSKLDKLVAALCAAGLPQVSKISILARNEQRLKEAKTSILDAQSRGKDDFRLSFHTRCGTVSMAGSCRSITLCTWLLPSAVRSTVLSAS